MRNQTIHVIANDGKDFTTAFITDFLDCDFHHILKKRFNRITVFFGEHGLSQDFNQIDFFNVVAFIVGQLAPNHIATRTRTSCTNSDFLFITGCKQNDKNILEHLETNFQTVVKMEPIVAQIF